MHYPFEILSVLRLAQVPRWTCLIYFISVLSKNKQTKKPPQQLNTNAKGDNSLVEAYVFQQMLVETVSRDSLGSGGLESGHRIVETAPKKKKKKKNPPLPIWVNIPKGSDNNYSNRADFQEPDSCLLFDSDGVLV